MSGVPSVADLLSWAGTLTPDRLAQISELGLPENVRAAGQATEALDDVHWEQVFDDATAACYRVANTDSVILLDVTGPGIVAGLTATIAVGAEHGWDETRLAPVLALLNAAGYRSGT